MEYINAFMFCGFVCLISQIIIDNTTLTSGHVNTLLVIVASFLEMFGLYSYFLETFHAGASVPITNFGYLLFNGALEGFKESGIIGLFTGILVPASAGIAFTIFIAFLVSLVSKPRH